MSTSTEFGTEFLSLRANSCCVEPNRRTADAATRLQEDYFVLECMGVAIRLAASITPEKCSAFKAGRVVAASGRMAKKTETTLISTATSTAGRSVSRVANTRSSNKKRHAQKIDGGQSASDHGRRRRPQLAAVGAQIGATLFIHVAWRCYGSRHKQQEWNTVLFSQGLLQCEVCPNMQSNYVPTKLVTLIS